MIKKTIAIFALLSCLTGVMAQEAIPVMRYIYQVDFLRAGKNPETPEKHQELMYLDIVDNTSRFASSGNIMRQEAMLEQGKPENSHLGIQERMEALKPFTSRFTGGVVFNDSKQLNTYNRSGVDYYNLEEPLDLIQWDITPEIQQINGMNAQKAIGELSGRVWTVYFTTDIPLQEGPYKFKNLPGLVIKASDDNGYFNFELIEVSKAQSSYWMDKSFSKATQVDKKQYAKVVKQNSNKSISQLLGERASGAKITKVVDENGNDVTNTTLNKKPTKDIYVIEIL